MTTENAIELSDQQIWQIASDCIVASDGQNAEKLDFARAIIAADRELRQAGHVGGSAFESWYSEYNCAHKSDKERAQDAYEAGTGDQRQAVQEAECGSGQRLNVPQRQSRKAKGM